MSNPAPTCEVVSLNHIMQNAARIDHSLSEVVGTLHELRTYLSSDQLPRALDEALTNSLETARRLRL